MLSFIICSIHPEEARRLSENIASTIGVEHEIIIIDNRNSNNGICTIYNKGANMAKGDNLCFLHEDILFHGNNWGYAIEKQLSFPDTGIIGFMGATYKSLSPSGWNVKKEINRSHFIQSQGGVQRKSSEIRGKFSPCTVLDGACLFMRRSVWQEHPFDEINIKGFHCYDIDICLQTTAANLVNYVCGTVWIEHFSSGSFSSQWATTTLELHEGKWKQWLPLAAKNLTNKELAYINKHKFSIEARSFYIFLKNTYGVQWRKQERHLLTKYLPNPFLHPITYLKCIKLLYL